MTTATDLIARSISHTEIASAEYDFDVAMDLQRECEDSVEASPSVEEFWGTDDDGNEWRVHLKGNREEARLDYSDRVLSDDSRFDARK